MIDREGCRADLDDLRGRALHRQPALQQPAAQRQRSRLDLETLLDDPSSVLATADLDHKLGNAQAKLSIGRQGIEGFQQPPAGVISSPLACNISARHQWWVLWLLGERDIGNSFLGLDDLAQRQVAPHQKCYRLHISRRPGNDAAIMRHTSAALPER